MQQSYLNLTTYGCKSGKAHTVEVSFCYENGKVYLLAHRRAHGLGTDWYRNLKVNSECEITIGNDKCNCRVFSLDDTLESLNLIRDKFIQKYGQAFYDSWYSETARLPVVLNTGIFTFSL